MSIGFGAPAFSGQPAAANTLRHNCTPLRFIQDDYLIGLALALQKKPGTEYLTGSGNTVQRKIGQKLQRVTLQYTSRSFYFSSIFDGAIHLFDYLAQDEQMTQFNGYAHVGKLFAKIEKKQICRVHHIAEETSAAGAVDLLLADYPGKLTMLHPIKTHRWMGRDRIMWYARQGGRHYRLETSKSGAALFQWSNNQILLRLTPEQIRLHAKIKQYRSTEED